MRPIQTVFFLLAAASAVGLYVFPFFTTTEGISQSTIFADQKYTISDNAILPVLFTLSAILCLIGVFLHQKRKRQIMLGRIALLSHIVGIIAASIMFLQEADLLEGNTQNIGAGLFLPVAFSAFVLLAIKYINKDEKLVRSMNRVR